MKWLCMKITGSIHVGNREKEQLVRIANFPNVWTNKYSYGDIISYLMKIKVRRQLNSLG